MQTTTPENQSMEGTSAQGAEGPQDDQQIQNNNHDQEIAEYITRNHSAINGITGNFVDSSKNLPLSQSHTIASELKPIKL